MGRSNAYYWGFGFGLVISAVIIIYAMIKYNSKVRYDERQMIARGWAYKIGFFFMMIEFCVAGFMDVFGNPLFMNADGMILLMFIALLVFVIICVFNDAYMTLTDKPKKSVLSLVCIGFGNFLIGLGNNNPNIKHFISIVDGKIRISSINLLCSLVIVLTLIAYGIKSLLGSRRDDPEEE
ncbi:MAG: hypothetical protein IKQ71_10755 [Lachnospiraceae bacterium]|nr:hypothetical protein [Lachnospiraceae bacterium]